MIRRAFWLGAGAAAGILGYRRVAALGRRLSPAPGVRPGHPVRGAISFARDVREGMDIYASRHALPSLGKPSSENTHDRKDGR
jgi:hypothetical protein